MNELIKQIIYVASARHRSYSYYDNIDDAENNYMQIW